MANIQSIFKPLEKLETSLAELYKWFSAHFASDAEATILFYRMSLEEKAHASLLQFQMRVVRQNPSLFSEVSVDLDEVVALTQKIRTLVEEHKPLSLEEAVALALEFEGSAAECHYRNVLIQARPDMSALIKSLIAADRQHLEGLQEFARARRFEDLSSRPLPRFPNL